jgi:DNA-binding transcriptional MerR regulator
MAEHRIDDLARLAGTTVRNVRAYQERGLLPPPRRQGRVGLFDDDHLARLKLIGHLLERGYTLSNIGELIAAWEKGEAIDDVLGMTEPMPDRVTVAWLVERFGGPDIGSDATVALATAIELGILLPEPVTASDGDGDGDGDGDDRGGGRSPAIGVDDLQFRVTNPRLLRAAVELTRAGVPLAAAAEHVRGVRRDVESLALKIVDLVDVHVFGPLGARLPTPEEATRISALIQRLQPLVGDVVLGELDRAIDEITLERLDERLSRLIVPTGPAPAPPRSPVSPPEPSSPPEPED